MDVEKVNKTVKVDLKEGLKSIFPEVFEDNKINFEKLRALLSGEVIEKEDDRFYFNWAGKSNIFKLIQTPAYGTLKPDKERSIDFENTKNIMIIGENLETLKLLLKPYFGKVKMIYIDPPYNTGKDFIYKDNFKEPIRDYLEKTGQIDLEGNKLTTNTESSGRYHSDWLNFMYPRLFLAKNLLRDDGVIFVSIDDHEVHHLRMIMDEIFGEENFVGEMIRKTKSMTGDKKTGFNLQHESLLCYAKDVNSVFLEGEEKDLTSYENPDNDPKGEWVSADPSAKSGGPSLYYEIVNPYTGKIDLPPIGRFWAFSKDTMQKYINEGKIVFKKSHADDERGFIFKRYKNELGSFKNPVNSLSFVDNLFMNQVGTKELRELLGGELFSNPKPVSFIKKIVLYATKPDSNDVILDFFAGSGTTGQAVWDLNKEDGGNRKFILVQLDEPVDESTETGRNALSLGLKTVADICIERLRRVSEKYKKEDNNHDFGFKVFRLDKSNFNLRDEFEISAGENFEELRQKYLDWLGAWVEQPLVHGWRNIDVVYEVILKEGLNLNSKIKEIKIKNNNFYYAQDVEQGLDFYISLDDKIDKETIEEVRNIKYKDKIFIFLDNALTDDDKINLASSVRLKVI